MQLYPNLHVRTCNVVAGEQRHFASSVKAGRLDSVYESRQRGRMGVCAMAYRVGVVGAAGFAGAIAADDEHAVIDAASPAEGEQAWQTFFANSGAEANEGAMKLARLYAKRRGNGGNTIVCLRGSFHGRTLETVAATMQERLQEDFRPLPQGFVACSPNNVEELRSIFEELGNEICAVMLEPIQGESGVHLLSAEFVRVAADLVHQAGGLLIADVDEFVAGLGSILEAR